jgi:hypothetical protein
LRMKRFDYTQTFEEYADYDSTRESDEVQRVTLVYPARAALAMSGVPPYVYLSMKDGTTRRISYEEGRAMLQEEVEAS